MPSPRSGACSPSPPGTRGAKARPGPGLGSRSPNERDGDRPGGLDELGVGALGPVPQGDTNGAPGSATPGWEIAIADRRRSRASGSASSSSRAPLGALRAAVGRGEDDRAVVALGRRGRRRGRSARPSPRRSTRPRALGRSRGEARTRIVSSEAPGRVRITFSSSTSSPSKSESKSWVETRAALDPIRSARGRCRRPRGRPPTPGCGRGASGDRRAVPGRLGAVELGGRDRLLERVRDRLEREHHHHEGATAGIRAAR